MPDGPSPIGVASYEFKSGKHLCAFASHLGYQVEYPHEVIVIVKLDLDLTLVGALPCDCHFGSKKAPKSVFDVHEVRVPLSMTSVFT